MTARSSAPPPSAAAPTAEGADDPWVGRVLGGRYRVLRRIAEGGMGTVYAAEHLTLQKLVALKLVHEAANADHARRFVREAMVTSRIDHPNVISAIDFGTFEDGTAFLAMQLVDGPTLAKVLDAEGCLSWVRAAEIGAQIADALLAAQAHGIVHRDLKPDNVIMQLLEDGTPLIKVLDFGIAKYARDSMAPPPVRGTLAVTRIGAVVGTPGYMAPEQAVGKRADHRADLYSLGVILWECIAGRRLWDFEDLQKLLGAQLNRPAPSVREASQDFTIPNALDDLVARLLAQNANDRPSSVADVRDELRELVLAVKQGVLQSAVRSSPRPPPVEAPESPADEASSASGSSRPETDSAAVENLVLAVATRVLRLRGRRVAGTGKDARGSALKLAIFRGLRWPAKLGLALAVGGLLSVTAWRLHRSPPRAGKTGRAAIVAKSKSTGTQASHPRPLDDSVRGELQTLIEGLTREERVSTAQSLLRHVPIEEVPTYARAMARMQLAETCAQKKSELGLFRTLHDPRTLPALVALSQRKRGGCGRRGHEDCLGCLRDELARLIRQLESQQAQKH